MKKRTRVRDAPGYIEQAANLVHWDGSQWVDDLVPLTHYTGLNVSQTDTYPYLEFTQDEIGGERGTFKEISHWAWVPRTWFPTPFGDLENRVYVAQGPFGPHAVRGIPNSWIVAQLPGWRPLGFPYDLKKLENFFSDPQLPDSLTITKDPFDTGFSVWFLIVDLLQLSNLFRQLLGPRSAIRALFSLTRDHPGLTAKELCNQHLATEFGVLPTIADMTSAGRILASWQKVYSETNELLQKAFSQKGKTDLSPKVERLNPLHQSFRVSSNPGALDAVDMTVHVDTRVELTHCLDLDYRFSCPEFQGWRSRLKQFVDGIGLLDPAALWDVIPFSFVIDWFFHVGTWLHRNRPRLFPASVVPEQYCESIKLRMQRQYRLEAYFLQADLHQPASKYTQLIFYEKYDAYLRKRFQPPPIKLSGSIQQDQSSLAVQLNRIALSASLLGQRVNPRARFR